MTKLQLLHRALNERLMAAVEQIMEMVGGTVLEYEEETVRARKENEILRRRLRWMEGEIPTDWPDEYDLPVPEQPIGLEDGTAQECLTIKTEPTDAFDSQSLRPDTSLTTSVLTTDLDTVNPGVSEPAGASVPDGTVWDSAHSYMAPLDFDPTMAGRWSGRGRSQRMSFACPDCGKVFGREQRLIFHMRIHSAERPYAYRRRKACFYGDKKRNRKLRGLSKVYPSKEFIEDLSDSSEQTERSAESVNISVPTTAAPSVPEVEPSGGLPEASEKTGSKNSESSAAKPVSHRGRSKLGRSKKPRCLECKKVFKNVAQLTMHTKTHREPVLSQEEQKEQEDAEKTDKRQQQHRKTPVMRNNETEVEKARAGGNTLFQCLECKKIFARSCWLKFHLKSHERERALARKEKKRLPSNKMRKSVLTVKDNSKDTTTENSSTNVFKKIFACPYCDKVFTREGWLGPHIRSHTVKTPRKSDLDLQSILPDSLHRRTRRIQLSKEDSNERKRVAKELNEKSEIDTEKPAKIPRANQMTSESKRDSQSKKDSNDSEIIVDGSSEITEESQIIPEESIGEGSKRSKKTFPCEECGKVYLLAGWLKTHKKIHTKERMLEEKMKTPTMMDELGQKEVEAGEQSLMEKIMENIVEKKPKRTKGLLKMKRSLIKKRQARNHDKAGMPPKENKSSDIQAAEAKNEEPPKKTIGRCTCTYCGKVYTRRNWLNMHMLGHREAKTTSQTKEIDEKQKNDNGQMAQEEGSSTEDFTVQKEKDRGKPSYPCPFCDKVFRRGMRLMMHMQIHSGEKPYSYRERKEQFYGDLTRPRVPDTYNQEPSIENNGQRKKDGGFAVTRNQTSAVSQDHTSTTETMETAQPHSVCTGRKFNLLPLKSAGAAFNHSTIHPRTDLESISNAISHFSLQPKIVLEPIVPESKIWASPGEDLRSVSAEISDNELHLISNAKTVDAATANFVDYPRKHNVPQTPNEKSNTSYGSKNLLSDINYTVISETHDPDILCIKLGSDGESYENSSHPEKMLVSIMDQQTIEHPKGRLSKFWQEEGLEENMGNSLLNIKQRTDGSKLEIGAIDVEPEYLEDLICNTSSVKTSCDVPLVSVSKKGRTDQAVVNDGISGDILLTTPECISSESSSTALQQVADPGSVCVILSDVSCDDNYDYPDHNLSNVPNNLHKKLISTGSKMPTGQLGLKGATTGQSAQKTFPSSSIKGADVPPHVELIPEETEELKACDGLLNSRDKVVRTSTQQTKEKGQKSSACMICGLVFAHKTSLSQHMMVHSSSGCMSKMSSTFKRVKNKETKKKVVHVQASEVQSDDSTDNSEILGKSDSVTMMEARKAKSSGVHPVARGQSSKGASKTSAKGRESKMGKESLYCRFCSKACRKIDLHLKYDHPREPEVIEALHISNTPEERKKLLSRLCCKKTSECDNTVALVDEDLVHCLFCQGSYRRNQFWKHALICEQKEPQRELTQSEATSSSHNPNTNLKFRTSIAQKTFDAESECPVQNTICSTAQQTLSESWKDPSSEVDFSAMQKSHSPLAPESDSTEKIPSPDQMSKGPPFLNSCRSTADQIPIAYSANTITKNSDNNPPSPPTVDSCHSALAPNMHDNPEHSKLVSEVLGHSVLQSCRQEALNQESAVPLLATVEPDIEQQSTLEFSGLPQYKSRFSNVQKSLGTFLCNSSFLGSGGSDLQKNTDQDLSTSQNLDCSAECVFLPELTDHVDPSLQLTSDLKSQTATIPTIDSSDF